MRIICCKEEGREKGWRKNEKKWLISDILAVVENVSSTSVSTGSRSPNCGAISEKWRHNGGANDSRVRERGHDKECMTNLQNHLHVVAVALGLLRALEARAVVKQGLGDTRLLRVRGWRWNHVDLHRHPRTALLQACVQRKKKVP